MSRTRGWTFTINNWQQHEPESREYLQRIECEYLVAQFERAPTTGMYIVYNLYDFKSKFIGNRHIQGYVYFNNPRTFGGVQRILRLIDGSYPHIEAARGTPAQNRTYCTKEETRDPEQDPAIVERGSMPAQGQRNDISRFVELARGNSAILDVLEECPNEFVKYHRAFDRIRQSIFRPRSTKTIVKWYWGPTGCGKSRAARVEGGENVYWKSPSTKWWCGYQQDDTVIVDDYRADFCKFSELLRLFDEYPLLIETKGGTIHFNSRVIIITCPKPPLEVWAQRTEEDLEQLGRRIEEVREFNVRHEN